MADPILKPNQEEILKLLEKHRKGLTTQEIHREAAKNLEIPAEEVDTALRGLAFFRFIQSEEVSDHQKWFITHQGLTELGVIENPPWP